MTNYIFKSKHNVFKIRFRVSNDLQSFFNRKEINKSLETKNYQEAINRANNIISKYKQLLQLRENIMITDEQLQKLVDKYIIETLEQDKLDRATTGYGTVFVNPSDTHDVINQNAIDTISGYISDYKRALATSDFSIVETQAIQLLETIGGSLNKEEPQHMLFLQTLVRANIDIFMEALNRYKGKYSPQYDIKTSLTKTKKSQSQDITINSAIKLFLRNYITKTSETQYREVSGFLLTIFTGIIDKDDLVENTTLEDLLEVREILSKLPKRNIQKYREMSIADLLDAQPTEDEQISSTTLNKYIKWLKMFYSFCSENNYIQKSPALSLAISSTTDALSERLPLTLEEISHLLSITSSDPIINNGIKALAYSGMRLSEMYKASITIVNDITCFDLTDKTRLKLKTKSSYRHIPIHSAINIELLKELPAVDTFSKKVNAIIREYISSDEKKVLYSLRHSFATELKNKLVAHEVISELMGHSHGTMTFGRYAGAYDVSILKEAIDKLNY